MRNIKKILALVLTVTMLAICTVYVSAATVTVTPSQGETGIQTALDAGNDVILTAGIKV